MRRVAIFPPHGFLTFPSPAGNARRAALPSVSSSNLLFLFNPSKDPVP